MRCRSADSILLHVKKKEFLSKVKVVAASRLKHIKKFSQVEKNKREKSLDTVEKGEKKGKEKGGDNELDVNDDKLRCSVCHTLLQEEPPICWFYRYVCCCFVSYCTSSKKQPTKQTNNDEMCEYCKHFQLNEEWRNSMGDMSDKLDVHNTKRCKWCLDCTDHEHIKTWKEMEHHLVRAKRMGKDGTEEERAVQLLKDRLAAIQTSVTVDVVKQLRELNYDAKSTERKKEMGLFDTIRMEFQVPVFDKDRQKKQMTSNNKNHKRIGNNKNKGRRT